MKEIKLTIDGKEIQLTEEQLMTLGIEVEKKRKNPFSRVAKDDVYYTVLSSGTVGRMEEYVDCQDDSQYDAANYFNDKTFAEQVALHQLLYRKLLKFSYDNACEDSEWNGENDHWLIFYDSDEKDFCIDSNDGFKMQGAVYFSNMDVAEQAIEEVVKPFVKEHPEFVW